jgi:hypothetical protein
MAVAQVIIHDRPDRVAISAPVEYNYQWDHPAEIEVLRARVNGRCQDLLAIVDPRCDIDDDKQDRICRIEFLHRSVRDFLNEAVSVKNLLKEHAGVHLFDTQFTLFACYVFLVKRASKLPGQERRFRHFADYWCTDALKHMRETPTTPSTLSLLYALDDGMQLLYADLGQLHWSNHLVEDPRSHETPPKLHDLDVTERGKRDLLGHLIELGLTPCVKVLLKSDSALLQRKEGRPYLDYALRFNVNTSFRLLQVNPERHTPDCTMIELLLGEGCDVNEVVHMYGNRTLWDSYLYFIYTHSAVRTNIDCHLRAVWLLIDGGAEQTEGRVKPTGEDGFSSAHDDAREVKTVTVPLVSMRIMLAELFGAQEAEAMQRQVSRNSRTWAWPMTLSWMGSQRRVTSRNTQFVWIDNRSTQGMVDARITLAQAALTQNTEPNRNDTV